MPQLARAIVLNNKIEELRFQSETRQLRLREKLELRSYWDELKILVTEPVDPNRI